MFWIWVALSAIAGLAVGIWGSWVLFGGGVRIVELSSSGMEELELMVRSILKEELSWSDEEQEKIKAMYRECVRQSLCDLFHSERYPEPNQICLFREALWKGLEQYDRYKADVAAADAKIKGHGLFNDPAPGRKESRDNAEADLIAASMGVYGWLSGQIEANSIPGDSLNVFERFKSAVDFYLLPDSRRHFLTGLIPSRIGADMLEKLRSIPDDPDCEERISFSMEKAKQGKELKARVEKLEQANAELHGRVSKLEAFCDPNPVAETSIVNKSWSPLWTTTGDARPNHGEGKARDNEDDGLPTAESLNLGRYILCERRRKQDVYLEDVAKGTGIDAELVSKIEIGTTIPRPSELQRLLNFYGTDRENWKSIVDLWNKIRVSRGLKQVAFAVWFPRSIEPSPACRESAIKEAETPRHLSKSFEKPEFPSPVYVDESTGKESTTVAGHVTSPVNEIDVVADSLRTDESIAREFGQWLRRQRIETVGDSLSNVDLTGVGITYQSLSEVERGLLLVSWNTLEKILRKYGRWGVSFPASLWAEYSGVLNRNPGIITV